MSSGVLDWPGLCHRRENIGRGIQSLTEAESTESLASIDQAEAAPREATVVAEAVDGEEDGRSESALSTAPAPFSTTVDDEDAVGG